MFALLVLTSFISGPIPVESIVIFSTDNRSQLRDMEDCEITISRDQKNSLSISKNNGCIYSNAQIFSQDGVDVLRVFYDVPQEEKFESVEFQYITNKNLPDAERGLTSFKTAPNDSLEEDFSIPSVAKGGSEIVRLPCWTVSHRVIGAKLFAQLDAEELKQTSYSWVLWRSFWPLYDRWQNAEPRTRVTKSGSSSLVMDSLIQDRKIDSCAAKSVK